MKKHSIKSALSVLTVIFLIALTALCITSCADHADDGLDTGTDAVTEHVHQYGEGQITTAPNCTEGGIKTYTCATCGDVKTEEIGALGHKFTDWTMVVENTPNVEGLERRECEVCDFFEERTISKIPAKYYITIDSGNGGILYWGVAEDGVYSIPTPIKVGYNFLGWKDENGNPFEASGVITGDIKIFAQWELDDTDSLAELKERAAAGTDLIHLTKDIVIDSPIYVTGTTRIYSDIPVKLTRAKNYAGDMFVVGQTEDGTQSILLGSVPELTLGGEGGSADNILITVDGNCDNLEVDVVGSAFFLVYGGNFNMYDGVAIINNKKIGNERSYTVPKSYVGTSQTVGGAAFIVGSGSSFHMYGGIIDNNSARTVAITNEAGESVNLSGYGGAIYNAGSVRIYGGTLSNNDANRGGAIYSSSVVKIYSGLLENNYASNKGGALCTSGSLQADTFISTEGAGENNVVFRGNEAGTQGGAILSYYDSPVVIYDGVLFENNKALGTSGGAISTSGPVTAYNTKFVGNTAKNYGGAIYHIYTTSEAVRELSLMGCSFESNNASSGGALAISSGESTGVGSRTKIEGCEFTNNTASGSGGIGGAIYSAKGATLTDNDSSYTGNSAYRGGAIGIAHDGVSEKDSVKKIRATITGSTFTDNKAENRGEEKKESRGGAIFMGEYLAVKLSDVKLENNSAGQYGGAISGARGSALEVKNSEFTENGSGVNGGALWLYTEASLVVEGTELSGNTASTYGGAIYAYPNIHVKTAAFSQNSAKCGGAIYIAGGTTVTEECTFSGNTATNGGAVYVAAGKVLTDTNSSYTENSAYQGGAIHVAYDEDYVSAATVRATVTGSTFTDNKAEKTATAEKARGGAIFVGEHMTVEISGAEFNGNSAEQYGGAVSVARGSTLRVDNSEFTENTSGVNGGALWLYEDGALDVENTAFNSNAAATNGGAIFAYPAINISGATFSQNSAKNGGAMYVVSTLDASNCTFTSNTATNGGAIYVAGGTTSTVGCTFTSNEATSGGAVYVKENATFKDGVDTTTDNGSTFTGNKATNGGAIYLNSATATISNTTFTGNTATLADVNSSDSVAQLAGGGAISANEGSNVTLDACTFTDNTVYTPKNTTITTNTRVYGAAVSAIKSKITVIGGSFSGNVFAKPEGAANYNPRTYGGAIGAFNRSEINISGGTMFSGNAGAYGGAIGTATNITLKINTAMFNENTANNCGGAIYLNGATAELVNITATSNTATNTGGGAIYASGCDGITLTESTFTSNSSANKSGGAIFASTPISISNTSFSQNTATNGGAIYTSSTLNASNCIFTSNEATSGGAVYVKENATFKDGVDTDTVQNAGSEFTGNKATNGGAIYLAAVEDPEGDPDHVAGAAELDGSTFEENEASANGGAIYFAGGTSNIVNSTFTGNSAKTKGGAIYAQGGTVLVITGSVFDGNNGASGAAIATYEQGTEMTLNQVELKNNTGTSGVVYVQKGSVATVTDLNAHDNAVKYGAVFYLATEMTSDPHTTLIVNSATISNNTANGSVGFIHTAKADNVVKYYKSNITGSDVNNNWDKLITGSSTNVTDLSAAG